MKNRIGINIKPAKIAGVKVPNKGGYKSALKRLRKFSQKMKV